MTRIRLPLLAASLLLLLAACGKTPDAGSDPASESGSGPQTALGRTVSRAIEEARRELETENIRLDTDVDIRIGSARIGSRGHSDLPRAEIAPDGSLLIEGEALPLDAEQQALSLRYRQSLVAIAEAGMQIGVEGADFGMRAAGDALKGLFSGNMDQVEKKIEEEARRFEKEAARICTLLPALLASQDALSASVPEFGPYARMTRKDIEDCDDDTRIADSVDGAGETDVPAALDPAAEADAAAGNEAGR